MRSVVVVLPASMCALMPMLRYRSMGVERGTMSGSSVWRRALSVSWAGCWGEVHAERRTLDARPFLEPEMREGLVGFGHAVHFLALLHRAAATFGRLEELRREPLAHRLFAALARRFAQPAHRKRHPPHGAHLDRDLEVRAAHATALHFDHRPRVRERLVEDFQRILAALLGDRFERAVQDALGDRFLAGGHQHVDELRDIAVAVLRIGQDLAFGNFSATGHKVSVRPKVKPYFWPVGLPSNRCSFATEASRFNAKKQQNIMRPSASSRRTWSAPACGP